MKMKTQRGAYPAAVRERVRRELLANGWNVSSAARATGVSVTRARLWRIEFGIPPLAVVPPRGPNREHRNAERELVRETLLANGGNARRTAEEFGLSTTTVRRWAIEFGFQPSRPGPNPADRRDEREHVRATLTTNGGNVKKAARDTGPPEATVRRWREEFEIEPLRVEEYPTKTPSDPWDAAAARSETFWSKVERDSSPNGCWLWKGATSRGYGRVNSRRGTGLAHRWAFEEQHGPLDGRPLHHTCKNKRCVNLAHLTPVPDSSAHSRLEKLEAEFVAYAQTEEGQAELASRKGGLLVA
jgi:transposase-like protein